MIKRSFRVIAPRLMTATVHRVISTEIDNDKGICYLYTRLKDSNSSIIRLKATYEVVIGLERLTVNANTIINEIMYQGRDSLRMIPLGSRYMHHRGNRVAILFDCTNYRSYCNITKKVEFDKSRDIFLCDSYSSPEDKTLRKYNIYGAVYVVVLRDTIRQATKAEEFLYVPKVAGIDMEMLSLNPVDPQCEVYMASYSDKDKSIVIYTSKYLSEDLTHNETKHRDNETKHTHNETKHTHNETKHTHNETKHTHNETKHTHNETKHRGNTNRGSATIRRSVDAIVQDTRPVSYVRVNSNSEIMVTLSKLIDAERPDIVTGYNLYNADLPIIYFTLRREMLDWHHSREGPKPYFHSTRKMVKKFIDSDTGITIRIPGTHVVDMYPYLEETLSRDEHKSLRLGDVSQHFLGEGKDPLTYKDLERIYHSGTMEEKRLVMLYCAKDALLPVKLYEYFGVWEFHSAMYNICGTDADRLMSKGMVDTTYGIYNNRAMSKGIMMDTPNNRIFRPSGGLVMSSRRGYYNNVYCLDVESMYPNIVIQHNIDSDTLVDIAIEDQLNSNIEYYYRVSANGTNILLDSRGLSHGFKVSPKGVLPTVLEELLSKRKVVKAKIRSCIDPIEKSKAIAEDQALKRSANSACGSLGEQTEGNPMSNCLLNDIITTTGRRIISQCRDLVEESGGTVIYGDTDSIFVIYDGDIQTLIDSAHGSLPSHLRFKLEYIADKFLMGNKKHYAYKVGNEVKIVGYKGDKSSSCIAVQMAFKCLVNVLLEYGPDETCLAYDELVRNCYNEKNLDIELFSWNMRYSGKGYSPGTHKYMLIEQMRSRGVEIVPGNSLEVTYVMRATDYLHKYGKHCDIALPDYDSKKYQLIYTLEEIHKRVDLIDVQAVFDSQCKSVLISMMSSYRNNV